MSRFVLSRREFSALAASSLLGAAPAGTPVALQLFSVRKQCEADLPGTLGQVAALGYQGVELAGYYGRTAQELRNLLDAHHLPCCGAHVPLDQMQGAKLQTTIRFHRDLGNNSLIVPGLPPDAMLSDDTWRVTAEFFAETAKLLREHEMRIGYHNHAIEFQAKKGQRPWDTFLRNSSEDVVIELDLGNAGYGAADPIALLKELKSRARFIHVKDYTAKKPDLIVGDGDMDWHAFFPAAQRADWFVIEHDSDPALNLADIAECLNRFREKQRLYNR